MDGDHQGAPLAPAASLAFGGPSSVTFLVQLLPLTQQKPRVLSTRPTSTVHAA